MNFNSLMHIGDNSGFSMFLHFLINIGFGKWGLIMGGYIIIFLYNDI